LENIATQLPSTLDDESLFFALRDQFKKDWPKKLTEKQLDIATTQYLKCLDRALSTKLGQLLPTIFRKIERIGNDVDEIKRSSIDFQRQFHRFEKLSLSQSEMLMQGLIGISNQIMIRNLEMSLPDDITLRPTIYLHRDEIIRDFQKDLDKTTCLSLVDGSGKGKTQLAVCLYEIHANPKKYWITLRNKDNTHKKHLQHQILRWLYKLTGESIYWQKYLSGEITFGEIVLILGKLLEGCGLLIIDDLPNPVDVGDLHDDLEILIKIFADYDVKLVTTSQWKLPPNLESRSSSIIIRPCPYFSLEEILDLLNLIRIPGELQNKNIAAWIRATTKGHPSLVTATVTWLEKQGEDFRIEIF